VKQQSLHNAIAWSYDLLSSEEQTLFRRFAVFSGGATLETAEEVTNVESEAKTTTADSPALGLLASLVAKHLLLRLPADTDDPRFGMLETTRTYGWERAVAAGEADRLRERHAAWMVTFAEASRSAIDTADEGIWFDRLETEHDNLRAALAWSAQQGDGERLLRLAAALRSFWFVRGHLSEGRRWLEEALARGDGARFEVWAQAANGAGNLAYHQGDFPSSPTTRERCQRRRSG
jgi:predicted ATPase